MKMEIQVINKQAMEGRLGVILSSSPCFFFFFVFLKQSVTGIHFVHRH